MSDNKSSNDGRSNVLSISRRDENRHVFPEAIGHEKILASCKKNRLEMGVKMMDGSVISGEITQFDRWSITLRMADEGRRTIYKHAIQYFEGLQ